MKTIDANNLYTQMQQKAYKRGTSLHLEHNDNVDYWDILLKDLKEKDRWKGKLALDFGCGKGRNVVNMLSLCDWKRVDGIDISPGNINWCNRTLPLHSHWYINDGVTVAILKSNEYDFIMSTIVLQHIAVYDIRRSLLTDLLRVLKPGGLFCFQMGCGAHTRDRPHVEYNDNKYDTLVTNGECDVSIEDEAVLIEDLKNIGYTDIDTARRPAVDGGPHADWVYVRCTKQ